MHATSLLLLLGLADPGSGIQCPATSPFQGDDDPGMLDGKFKSRWTLPPPEFQQWIFDSLNNASNGTQGMVWDEDLEFMSTKYVMTCTHSYEKLYPMKYGRLRQKKGLLSTRPVNLTIVFWTKTEEQLREQEVISVVEWWLRDIPKHVQEYKQSGKIIRDATRVGCSYRLCPRLSTGCGNRTYSVRFPFQYRRFYGIIACMFFKGRIDPSNNFRSARERRFSLAGIKDKVGGIVDRVKSAPGDLADSVKNAATGVKDRFEERYLGGGSDHVEGGVGPVAEVNDDTLKEWLANQDSLEQYCEADDDNCECINPMDEPPIYDADAYDDDVETDEVEEYV